MYIKFFEDISKKDVNLVGGKGASLGEMVNAAIPVPPGFVITTGGFEKAIEKEILRAFDNLNAQKVAVRSSATAEDSSQASWAGQLETFLNVTREDLLKKIKDCWDSIKSQRAKVYAEENKVNESELKVAVVVQKMVESKISGVMFTVNPVTGESDEIIIESIYGLGELLVQGSVTPDNFVINRKTLEIKEKEIGSKERMLVFMNGENQEIDVSKAWKNEQSIANTQINHLAKLAIDIENHYGGPQDIEWAIDDRDKIWILQSRPITTL